MRIAYHRRRLADFLGGMRLSRELIKHERWPKGRLRRHQQERLDALVRHAMRHSPFYRELLSGVVGNGPVELSRLPVLDKTRMMEHYDELVTDPASSVMSFWLGSRGWSRTSSIWESTGRCLPAVLRDAKASSSTTSRAGGPSPPCSSARARGWGSSRDSRDASGCAS
jgi:hypothetical protein